MIGIWQVITISIIIIAGMILNTEWKKKNNFYTWVFLFGALLGPVFDVANYFFQYFEYNRNIPLVGKTSPALVLILYGACCVILIYLSERVYEKIETKF